MCKDLADISASANSQPSEFFRLSSDCLEEAFRSSTQAPEPTRSFEVVAMTLVLLQTGFVTPLVPSCVVGAGKFNGLHICTTSRTRPQQCSYGTRSSSFVPFFTLQACSWKEESSKKLFQVRCGGGEKEDEEKGEEDDEEQKKFVHKYDPNSSTDAFGRDPRKETQYWMGAAKSVLASDEVREAIENHAADGDDGLTDDQRAYMEFIKSMDAKKSDE